MLPFNTYGSWRMLPTLGYTDGIGPDSISDPLSINSKGAWTKLTGTLTKNASGIFVQSDIVAIPTGSHSYLMDIGIGTGASPSKTLVSNILFSMASSGYRGDPLLFPVAIAAPTNLWVRYQVDIGTTTTVKAYINPYKSSFNNGETLARVQTIGASSSGASRGTTIVPSSTIGTPGSWVDLSPVTSFDTRFIVWNFGNALDYSNNVNSYLQELAVKAADGNRYTKAWVQIRLHDQLNYAIPGGFCMPVNIARGSTLSCRSTPLESTSIDNTDAVVYCVG